jgi:hypothetical protein
MLREHVEQPHHAVDDLDRALRIVVGAHLRAILQRAKSIRSGKSLTILR